MSEFYDADRSDSIAISVAGLPPGLIPIMGMQSGGRKQVRVLGQLRGVPEGKSFDVTWSAADGKSTQAAHTSIRTELPAIPIEEIEKRVMDTVTMGYQHGMSPFRARALGPAALPTLARLLRDEGYKRHWSKVVQAIGNIGDTAYFDTLHAFVWDRFHGEIDQGTFGAIELAQGNLYPIATLSERALEYLMKSANPESWASLPWSVQGLPRASVSYDMVQHTLSALSFTDSDRVDPILQALPVPVGSQSMGDRYMALHVRSLRDAHSAVRRRGFIPFWEANGFVMEPGDESQR